MKKKPRIVPSSSFYSSEPAVSRKKIAMSTPVANANLAQRPNKVVPKSPGKLSGLAGFSDKGHLRKRSTGVSIPKLGTKMKFPQQGKKGKA